MLTDRRYRLLLVFCLGLAGLLADRLTGRAQQTITAGEVLQFRVPDALLFANGSAVSNATEWRDKRRPEIVKSFEAIYGKTPAGNAKTTFQLESTDQGALGGKAARKEIAISFGANLRPTIHVLLYLPVRITRPVPVFVGLNFGGNHTISSDPGIPLRNIWITDPSDVSKPTADRRHISQTPAMESRGKDAESWPVEAIVSRGYGLATAYYGDVEPDFQGGLSLGIRSLFLKEGQTSVAPVEWGTLAAWAWGMSRVADYLQTDPDVAGRKLALIGHSRIGKAALWAAAQDPRFALVISNESGVGGASLYRAKTGETIEHLNSAFPYWFCENFHQYTGHPDRVPADGNLLLALIAPRPLYVASAQQDTNSNPAAEFLSLRLASRVYSLLGQRALSPEQDLPPIDTSILSAVGYHERSGKHGMTSFDWEQYLLFADRHFQHPGTN